MPGGITGEEGKVYSEEDWANPDKLDAYAKSKTLAEKAAWEYIKELPGKVIANQWTAW